MEEASYGKRYLKHIKQPNLPFKYKLIEEILTLQDIERAEHFHKQSFEKKRDEEEREKIIAGLDNERRKKVAAESRRKILVEMTDELRDLRHYLNEAENARVLVDQLRKQDIEIEERYKLAIKQANDIQNEVSAAADRERKAELDLLRKGHEYRSFIISQVEEHETKQREKKRIILEEGQQMKTQVEKYNKEQLEKLKALALQKEKLRKDTAEFVRLREGKIDDKKEKDLQEIKVLLETQREKDALEQSYIDSRNARIRRQLEVGAKIGEKIYAIKSAKEEKICNLIERFVNDQESMAQRQEDEEQQKKIEYQQKCRRNMNIQMAEKEMMKQKIILTTENLRMKRLEQSHDISEMNLLRKRMEHERRQIEQYLKGKAMDREELKAEEKAEQSTSQNAATQLEQAIESVRLESLNNQPISVLRYLRPSLLRKNYLPQPLNDRVREQIRQDPITSMSVKRHQSFAQRLQTHADPVVCCTSCPPLRSLSNIF